jgi:integrase
MLEEQNARQGFVDHASFLALREALPEWLQDPVGFLYFSGWRVSEMRGLEWRDVDLPGRVVRLRPELSKNKTGRVLPLSGELLQLIERAAERRRLSRVPCRWSSDRRIP